MVTLKEVDLDNPLHLVKLNVIFSSVQWKLRAAQRTYALNPSISVFFIYHEDKIIGTVAIDEINGVTGMAHFAIMPAFQRQGFGRQTLSMLKEIFDDLVLINKPSNSLARTLYKGMNYINSNTH